MNYTLQQIMNAIITPGTGQITIDGAVALLTRQEYYNAYPNQINAELFVPILSFNSIELTVAINDTVQLQFSMNDLFVADDWICVNRTD